ncbi:MAG: serine/threonine-protein phosphatase [Oscillospiraceae bacterium]|nr:serine/threonine-protein phosphatase [Oscillospiraceae bacterium]
MYYCCGITEKGVMSHNEDAMMLHHQVMTKGEKQISVQAPFLAAVCDGVSGEHAGELASKTCLTHLSQVRFSKRLNLKRKILEVHRQIAAATRGKRTIANMQTTLCCAAFDEFHTMHCINVGDSRIYRCRGGVLEQLSRDQTLVQMLYEEGTITSEEKKSHSHRNIILPVIGNLDEDPNPELKIYPEGLQYGDLLLLCSDGLTDYVSNTEIEAILAQPKKMQDRLSMLVSLALKKGGTDNITIIAIVRYPDDIPIPSV